jgi:isoquinoline 1-oxidoreductase alpha subunit
VPRLPEPNLLEPKLLKQGLQLRVTPITPQRAGATSTQATTRTTEKHVLARVKETSAAYEERGTIMIKLKINGEVRSWDGDPDLPLLWFLRDEAGLTGTKYGCGQALCGACTVIVDKQAVRACITSVSDVVDREVVTIEGLHPTGDHPVQKAWRQVNVPQCGFCQTGQIMQAAALLTDNPKPTHDQIREAMAGNICRCGCYQRIENAIHLASTGV